MFSFFKENNITPQVSTTETVVAIAAFLIDDTGSDLATPFKGELDVTKLDYSPESLRILDNFINKVRGRVKNLSDIEFTKLVVRSGAYCGEVIRRNSEQKYIWSTYDEVTKNKVLTFPKGTQTFYLLTSVNFEIIYFPMAKAVKFIHDGPADNFEGLWLLSQSKN